jgi:MFS transporter, UMF1 family
MDKFAGMVGPSVMGFVAAYTGSSRLGILSILIFFVVGAAVLWMVDEEEGRKVAREAQRRARPLDEVSD